MDDGQTTDDCAMTVALLKKSSRAKNEQFLISINQKSNFFKRPQKLMN